MTAKDIGGGRIRIPHETKGLFPEQRARISVDLLGRSLTARWDPRNGPDQERSGVISMGRQHMRELIKPDEVLVVRPTASGVSISRNVEERRAPGSSDRVADLTAQVAQFASERDWAQFHSLKNLAISLFIEVAELAELMQWRDGEELRTNLEGNREAVADELVDIMWFTLLIAHYQGIDLAEAFAGKMKKNRRRYPVHKAKGSSAKYTEHRPRR